MKLRIVIYSHVFDLMSNCVCLGNYSTPLIKMPILTFDLEGADDLVGVNLDETELIDWERLDFSFSMDQQYSNPSNGNSNRNTHLPDAARRGPHVAGPMGGPSEVGIFSSSSQSHPNDSLVRFI
jgi:hypothetical protein